MHTVEQVFSWVGKKAAYLVGFVVGIVLGIARVITEAVLDLCDKESNKETK